MSECPVLFLPHLESRGSGRMNILPLGSCYSPLKDSSCVIGDAASSPHHHVLLHLHVHGRWPCTSLANVVSTVQSLHRCRPNWIRSFFLYVSLDEHHLLSCHRYKSIIQLEYSRTAVRVSFGTCQQTIEHRCEQAWWWTNTERGKFSTSAP